MLFCSHVVVLLPNAQEELLALKKAQEQPPVNANAELTLRKKLNAAKKKKKNGKGNTTSKDDQETPEQDDDGGQGSSTDKEEGHIIHAAGWY